MQENSRGWEAAALVALVIAIGYAAGLRELGRGYSPDWRHRAQTEAFFRGTLALQPVPFGQRADWAWGHGSQQVWGLGVAMVRAPFESLGRVSGARGFPDRLLFVLLYAAVLAAWWRALDDAPGDATDARVRIAAVLAVGALPAFVTLCRTRFSGYEEPAAYGYLCGWLQFAALAGYLRHRSTGWVLVAAAAAGFGILIRPTLLLTGVVTMAILATVAWRQRVGVPHAFGAGALFTAGVVAAMVTNLRRFGDPFEFGQRLNVSRFTLDQLSKNFDAPYWHEPPLAAARELMAAIFGMGKTWNGLDVYRAGIHPWFSETVRFREFYFSTFGPVTAIAIVAAALVALTARPARPLSRLLFAWGALAFVALFCFYARMPSMTSRYVMDFAAPIAALVAALVLSLPAVMRDRRGPLVILVVTTFAVIAGSARSGVARSHAQAPLATADEIYSLMPAPVLTGPALPPSYRCGNDLAALGILFNGVGWDARGNCAVDVSSTFYLPQNECVMLELAPADGATGFAPGEVERIRIKSGLIELRRTPAAGGGEGQIAFCRPEGVGAKPASDPAIVSVAWTSGPPWQRPAFRLLAIASQPR